MSNNVTITLTTEQRDTLVAVLMGAPVAVLPEAAPAAKVPAKPKARKVQPKADRQVTATSHTWLGERAVNGTRKLTKANRAAFIAAHGWAKPGMSTNTLRSEVAMGRKVNKGWNVAF